MWLIRRWKIGTGMKIKQLFFCSEGSKLCESEVSVVLIFYQRKDLIELLDRVCEYQFICFDRWATSFITKCTVAYLIRVN